MLRLLLAPRSCAVLFHYAMRTTPNDGFKAWQHDSLVEPPVNRKTPRSQTECGTPAFQHGSTTYRTLPLDIMQIMLAATVTHFRYTLPVGNWTYQWTNDAPANDKAYARLCAYANMCICLNYCHSDS